MHRAAHAQEARVEPGHGPQGSGDAADGRRVGRDRPHDPPSSSRSPTSSPRSASRDGVLVPGGRTMNRGRRAARLGGRAAGQGGGRFRGPGVTFGELADRIAGAAGSLAGRVRRGDRVGAVLRG
ncbi:hypothetical protein HBB16_00930 [Pseudonocardia sp. MCCB 268]|nr:hypothetical protein [Pseudonocardia cytotoxica]